MWTSLIDKRIIDTFTAKRCIHATCSLQSIAYDAPVPAFPGFIEGNMELCEPNSQYFTLTCRECFNINITEIRYME